MAASGERKTHHPGVMWAQRKDRIFLTVNLEDAKDAVIKLEENQLHFTAKRGIDSEQHEFILIFYNPVLPQESKYVVLPRNIPMVIMKKEEAPSWPRLTKEKEKLPWLQTDWNKWKDSDESDQGVDNKDLELEEMMSKMGNFDAGAAAGAGADAMMAALKNTEGDLPDSDDEPLPDLE